MHAFPQQLDTGREAHAAFIAGRIGHQYVGILQVGLPVTRQYSLCFVDIQLTAYLTPDFTHYLKILEGTERIDAYPAEQLVMQVGIQLGYQVTVRKTAIGLKDHQRHFTYGGKVTLAATSVLLQPEFLC